MPQMSPMNWLMMFFVFSLIFILFNMMNYYSFINYPLQPKSSKNKIFKTMNWKW